jgi:hypothetical protein
VFRVNLLFLAFILFTCGKPLPSINNIDLNSWKQDKNGCGQFRTSIIAEIDLQKDKLLALDEKQVVELLGNPDRNELYKRNQKFYYYYLKPSPDCQSPPIETSRLVIRFNAMGLAKEVFVE